MFSSCEARLMIERARKNAEMAPFNLNNWLPLADTLLTNTPKYGSSNMIRMRKLVNDVRFNTSANADEGYSDDNILRAIIQNYDMVERV